MKYQKGDIVKCPEDYSIIAYDDNYQSFIVSPDDILTIVDCDKYEFSRLYEVGDHEIDVDRFYATFLFSGSLIAIEKSVLIREHFLYV
jgi:hypothetical protein